MRKLKLNLIFIILLLLGFTLFLDFGYCFSDSDIEAKKAIIIDADSGSVLYSKNGFEKVYPASTTKILTAICVLENLDIKDSVIVSESAIKATPYGSSTMYAKAGEILSIENLLYGLLLPSGNDAANILAEAVSKDIDEFVKLMNKKAIEIGCTNTNFVNPHGFYHKNHYTTPYDMSKILRYALKNETLKKILETKYYEIPSTNKTPSARGLTNTNKLINKKYDTSYYYEYALGGKTGYTDESQGTLVTYGKKDDKNIIITLFNSPQTAEKETRFYDAKTLFDFSFSNFVKTKILDKESILIKYMDEKNGYECDLTLKNDIYSLASINDTSKKIISYNNADIDINLIDENILNNEENVNIYNDLSNDTFGNVDINLKTAELLLNDTYNLTLSNYINTTPWYKKIYDFLTKDDRTNIIFMISLLGFISVLIIIKIILIVNIKKKEKFNFSSSSRIKLKKHKEKF